MSLRREKKGGRPQQIKSGFSKEHISILCSELTKIPLKKKQPTGSTM